jgi:hypothetical protein
MTRGKTAVLPRANVNRHHFATCGCAKSLLIKTKGFASALHGAQNLGQVTVTVTPILILAF